MADSKGLCMVQEYGSATMSMVIINDSVRGGHDCFLRWSIVTRFSKYSIPIDTHHQKWLMGLQPSSRWISCTLRCRHCIFVPFAFLTMKMAKPTYVMWLTGVCYSAFFLTLRDWRPLVFFSSFRFRFQGRNRESVIAIWIAGRGHETTFLSMMSSDQLNEQPVGTLIYVVTPQT